MEKGGVGHASDANNIFNEFTLEVPNAEEYLLKLENAGILGGIKLDKNVFLPAREWNDVC